MYLTMSARLLTAFFTIKGAVAYVDPTDLKSWPECAQACIPTGFTPDCNSLSNRECICQQPAFTLAIADCEQSLCTLLEKDGECNLTACDTSVTRLSVS